ncbi:MAG: hypothetical protein ACYCWE_14450 [Eubacteriales bacterium]
MLEVKTIQNKEEQKRLCSLCGIEYNADALAYSASEDVGFIGIIQFAIQGKIGIIYNIALCPGVDDNEALFIMGRAAMNFIDLCKISDVYFEDKNEHLGNILGFKQDIEGRYYINIKGFFETPCKHCN